MARSPTSVEDMNFDDMNDGQLRELIHSAREHLGQRITRRLDEFRALALEAGFEVTMTKLGEGTGRRGRRRTGEAGDSEDRRRIVTPKYRNPDNHAETWSGRGREPRWYKDKIAAGVKEDSLLIQPQLPETAQHTPAEPEAAG